MIKEECCTCTDRLNYVKLSEKYDQLESIHEVLVEDNLTYENQISDLEAKLVESEENNKLLEMQLQDMERSKLSWENQYFTLYNTLKNYREVTEKKHLLDETEWQDYCAYKHIEPQIKGCLDREKELTQQLAEKEKELKAKETLNQIFKDNREAKISFAVEQLEKVKEYIKTNLMSFQKVPIIQEINNQIKQLKEMK